MIVQPEPRNLVVAKLLICDMVNLGGALRQPTTRAAPGTLGRSANVDCPQDHPVVPEPIFRETCRFRFMASEHGSKPSLVMRGTWRPVKVVGRSYADSCDDE